MTSTPSLERVSCSLTSKKGNASLSIPEKPDTRLHNLILLTSRALKQSDRIPTHTPDQKVAARFPRGKHLLYSQRWCCGCKKNNHSNTSHWTDLRRQGCYLLLLNRVNVQKKKKKNWCWFSAHAGWHRWLAEINKGARAPANISTFLCRICICKQEKIDVQCVPFCKYCSVVVLVLTSKKKCRQSYLLSFKHTQIHICT